MRKAILILLVFGSQSVSAQGISSYFKKESLSRPKSVFTKSNFFVGHSLSQTSYTLPKGKWMAGTFALGYGLTNNLTLGTSPWLLTLYNMPNVIVRAKKELSTSSALGAHFGYMKTANYLRDFYEMELLYGNLIYSTVVNKNIRTHFQLNAMHFANEDNPFSIRVSEPTTKTQISVSNISEVLLFKTAQREIGIGLEAGVLGANESLPYIHGGLSFYQKTKNLFIQFGLSLSASKNLEFSELQYVGRGDLPPGGEFREALTHPEIQVQYYF